MPPAARSDTGLYPPDTSIVDMGLAPQEVSLLTNDARQLDKRQLVTLREVAKEFRSQGEDKVLEVFDQRTGLSLSIGDLTSVAHAFDDMQDRLNATGLAADTSACCCCSCCPCCTCTASVVIAATR